MKIDTQGMSLPLDPNYKEKTSVEEQRSNLKPATIRPRRLFTCLLYTSDAADE